MADISDRLTGALRQHPEGGWFRETCVVSPGFDYTDFALWPHAGNRPGNGPR